MEGSAWYRFVPRRLARRNGIGTEILRILAENEKRPTKYTWEEELAEELGVPWKTILEELEALEKRGMISMWFPGRPKWGRHVRITELGGKHASGLSDP